MLGQEIDVVSVPVHKGELIVSERVVAFVLEVSLSLVTCLAFPILPQKLHIPVLSFSNGRGDSVPSFDEFLS